MVRVLHLLDDSADYQAERGAALLSSRLPAEFSVTPHCLGRGGERGLLSRIVRLRELARRMDLVHAWGSFSLRAAAAAGAKRIVFSPSDACRRSDMLWLRAFLRLRNVRVVCSTHAQKLTFANHSLPEEHLHVVSPGVDAAAAAVSRDDRLREELGFTADDRVLLAPGESTRSAGHALSLWTASILHVLSPRWKLLVWGRGNQVAGLTSRAAKFAQRGLLVAAEQKLGKAIPFDRLASAADFALFTPSDVTPVLAVLSCMAAGLPVVAPPGPFTSGWLYDGDGAGARARPSPRLLAQRVLALQADESLQRQIAGRARVELVVNSSIARFVESYQAIYQG